MYSRNFVILFSGIGRPTWTNFGALYSLKTMKTDMKTFALYKNSSSNFTESLNLSYSFQWWTNEKFLFSPIKWFFSMALKTCQQNVRNSQVTRNEKEYDLIYFQGKIHPNRWMILKNTSVHVEERKILSSVNMKDWTQWTNLCMGSRVETMVPLIHAEYKTQKLKICVKLSINYQKSMGKLFASKLACGLNIKKPIWKCILWSIWFRLKEKKFNGIMQLRPNDTVQIYRPFGFIYGPNNISSSKFWIFFAIS